MLGGVNGWADTNCLTGPMTCSPKRTTLCRRPSSVSRPRKPTTACSGCAELFRYLETERDGKNHLANMLQLSMTHQLLPKEEWTKPEEVRKERP